MYDVVMPTARACMSTRVLSFALTDDLFEAIDELLKNSYAAAPVIDDDQCLLGMLTEKDCLRVLSNLAYDDDLEGGTVKDYLSPIRIICEPEMDIFGVTDRFLSCNFPLLPVVDNGRLVGVISRRDTLRGVRELRDRIDQARSKLERDAGHQADRPRAIENLQQAAGSQTRAQFARLMSRKS